jgi:hypothetical protein
VGYHGAMLCQLSAQPVSHCCCSLMALLRHGLHPHIDLLMRLP